MHDDDMERVVGSSLQESWSKLPGRRRRFILKTSRRVRTRNARRQLAVRHQLNGKAITRLRIMILMTVLLSRVGLPFMSDWPAAILDFVTIVTLAYYAGCGVWLDKFDAEAYGDGWREGRRALWRGYQGGDFGLFLDAHLRADLLNDGILMSRDDEERIVLSPMDKKSKEDS